MAEVSGDDLRYGIIAINVDCIVSMDSRYSKPEKRGNFYGANTRVVLSNGVTFHTPRTLDEINRLIKEAGMESLLKTCFNRKAEIRPPGDKIYSDRYELNPGYARLIGNDILVAEIGAMRLIWP